MQIAHRKSLVAGLVLLILFVRTLYIGTHSYAPARRHLTLVLYPLVSALCFWHGFEGRRPLMGRSEIHTSIFLGVVSLIVAVVHTFLAVRYDKTFSLMTAVVFYAAAVFYVREALREKQSSPA